MLTRIHELDTDCFFVVKKTWHISKVPIPCPQNVLKNTHENNNPSLAFLRPLVLEKSIPGLTSRASPSFEVETELQIVTAATLRSSLAPIQARNILHHAISSKPNEGQPIIVDRLSEPHQQPPVDHSQEIDKDNLGPPSTFTPNSTSADDDSGSEGVTVNEWRFVNETNAIASIACLALLIVSIKSLLRCFQRHGVTIATKVDVVRKESPLVDFAAPSSDDDCREALPKGSTVSTSTEQPTRSNQQLQSTLTKDQTAVKEEVGQTENENDLIVNTAIVLLAMSGSQSEEDRCIFEPDLCKRVHLEWSLLLPIQSRAKNQTYSYQVLIRKLTRLSKAGTVTDLLTLIVEWLTSLLASSKTESTKIYNLVSMVEDLYNFLLQRYDLPAAAVITLMPFILASASIEDIYCEKKLGKLVFSAESRLVGGFYEEKHVTKAQKSSQPSNQTGSKQLLHSSSPPQRSRLEQKKEEVRGTQGSMRNIAHTSSDASSDAAEAKKEVAQDPAIQSTVEGMGLHKKTPAQSASRLATAPGRESHEDELLLVHGGNQASSLEMPTRDTENHTLPTKNSERPTKVHSRPEEPNSHLEIRGHDGGRRKPLLLGISDVGSEKRMISAMSIENPNGSSSVQGIASKSEGLSVKATHDNNELEAEDDDGKVGDAKSSGSNPKDLVEDAKQRARKQHSESKKDSHKIPIHGSERHHSPRSKDTFLQRKQYVQAVRNLKQRETFNPDWAIY